MDELLSEKEQIEQLRSWWSEYGGYIIGGLGLGIALLGGYNWYENSKLEEQLAGSSMYETLTGQISSGSLEEAEFTATQLDVDFAGTSYAGQAKLAMARLYMDKNRDQDAADTLRQLLDSDTAEELKLVARSRLAHVLLYQGKAQEVVELLDGQDSAAFAAIYSELLGDAYAALGQVEEARAAYQAVLLDPMAQATVDQQLVQWKVLDLAEVPASDAGSDDIALEDLPVAEPAVEDAVESPEAEGSE